MGHRLALAPRTIQQLIEALAAVERACQQLCTADDLRPSEVVTALRGLSLEMLPLLLARLPWASAAPAYPAVPLDLAPHPTDLTGADLKRLGVPQGPQIGRLLARVLAAKLDGEATTRESEEALYVSSWWQTSAS